MRDAAFPPPPNDDRTKLTPAAWQAQIAALRGQGDIARALALAEQALAAFPDLPWPATEIVALHRRRGDRAAARKAAEATLARIPRHVGVLIQLGLMERDGGEGPAALAWFERAEQAEPANLDVALHLAQQHFALGQLAACDAALDRAVALDRLGVRALLAYAQRLLATEEHASALVQFETAIRRCPWEPAGYIGAANALLRLGQPDEALAMIGHAIAQCGPRPALQVREAQLLRDLGLYAESLAAAEAAALLHPDHFGLWEAATRLHILIGEAADAAASLARARPSREEERTTLALLRGDAAAEAGDAEAAHAHYSEAAAMAPAAPRPQACLTITCLTLLRIEQAEMHWRRHVALQAPSLRLRNRSDNPLQSYFGQIVNDFRLDAAIVASIDALPAEPAARIAPLRALVARCPDSTLAAVALMQALFRDARFAPMLGERYIPRRLVQFWDAPAPPPDVARLMRSWTSVNPDFQHCVFDERAARDYLFTHFPAEVLEAFHRAHAPAMKADLFRLATLLHEGGVYVDADDRSTRPLSELLPDGARLCLYREAVGSFGNNFIAAASGHCVLRRALDQAVGAILRGDQETLWLMTGPGLLTRAFAQEVATDEAVLATTQVWTRRELLRRISIHCAAGYKETDQHWLKAAFATTPNE